MIHDEETGFCNVSRLTSFPALPWMYPECRWERTCLGSGRGAKGYFVNLFDDNLTVDNGEMDDYDEKRLVMDRAFPGDTSGIVASEARSPQLGSRRYRAEAERSVFRRVKNVTGTILRTAWTESGWWIYRGASLRSMTPFGLVRLQHARAVGIGRP